MFDMSTSEKIAFIARRKKVSTKDMASRLGISRQHLYTKFKTNDLNENEIAILCEMLDLDFKIEVFEKDSNKYWIIKLVGY
mgnify:CR=1 FL=1